MHRIKSQLERDLDKFAESVKSSDLDQIIHRKSEKKESWNENVNVYHYRYQRLRNHINEQDFMLPQSPDFYPRFDKASKTYSYAPATTDHYSHKPTFSSDLNTQFSATTRTQNSPTQRSPSSIKIRNLKPPFINLQKSNNVQRSVSTSTPTARVSPSFTLPPTPVHLKTSKSSFFASTLPQRKSSSNLAQLYRQRTELDKPIQKAINEASPSIQQEFNCIKNRILRQKLVQRVPSGNNTFFEASAAFNAS